jgi:integrase
VEKSAERKTATIGQVHALADAIEPRFRALVLLAAFSGLRFGELSALTRGGIDLEAGTVTVTESAAELQKGVRLVGDPKTERSRRTVALPSQVAAVLAEHVDRYVSPEPGALVFTGDKGGADPSRQLPPRVDEGPPHRGEHGGTHGPDGARQPARRPDLPARHRRP